MTKGQRMKTITMLCALVAILMLCFGCATTKVVSIENRPDPTNGKSNAVVYAPVVVPHFGFMVDGVDKGTVETWKPLYFQVDPGQHRLHTRTPIPMIIDRELMFDFKPNTTNYFKLEHKAGFWSGSNFVRPTGKIESFSAKVPK